MPPGNNTTPPGNNDSPPNNATPNNNTPAPNNTTPSGNNTTPPVDMGGNGQTTPGGANGQAQLGPLVTESPGIEGGCAQGALPSGTPRGALLVALFGLFAIWRRQKRG
jgi:hypothetical protein